MNLVTVINNEFKINALNLIESYRRYSANAKILICHFGGLDKKFINVISDYYKGQVIFREVEHTCPHAHNPRFYFFKTYALHAAMKLNEPFIYLDAASAFLSAAHELERILHQHTRVFVQYPMKDFFKNVRWTTRVCFQSMGCDADRFKNAHQYEGGFQAYMPTKENLNHIDEMYRLMHDPLIAGPSNHKQNPDGNGVCQAHRNEQSVLSILVERNAWHQPYNTTFFVQYGDTPTLQTFTPECLTGTENIRRIVSARQSPTQVPSEIARLV